MVTIDRWRPGDPVTPITELLHRAYRPLAEVGMRFLASHQDDEMTRTRLAASLAYVAVEDGQLVGTVAYHPPADNTRGSPEGVKLVQGTPWYCRPDVAWFEQLAVDPDRQRSGIAARLLDYVEALARTDGAVEIALDTSERASHLIELYGRRGYRIVDRTSWDVTNYASVIMSKALRDGAWGDGPRPSDATKGAP